MFVPHVFQLIQCDFCQIKLFLFNKGNVQQNQGGSDMLRSQQRCVPIGCLQSPPATTYTILMTALPYITSTFPHISKHQRFLPAAPWLISAYIAAITMVPDEFFTSYNNRGTKLLQQQSHPKAPHLSPLLTRLYGDGRIPKPRSSRC